MIQVANTKVFARVGNGSTVDLTQDTNTIYTHPTTKQCNYTPDLSNINAAKLQGYTYHQIINNAASARKTATVIYDKTVNFSHTTGDYRYTTFDILTTSEVNSVFAADWSIVRFKAYVTATQGSKTSEFEYSIQHRGSVVSHEITRNYGNLSNTRIDGPEIFHIDYNGTRYTVGRYYDAARLIESGFSMVGNVYDADNSYGASVSGNMHIILYGLI